MRSPSRPVLALVSAAGLVSLALVSAASASGSAAQAGTPRFALHLIGVQGGEPSVAYEPRSDTTWYATGGTAVYKIKVDPRGALRQTLATPPVAPDTLDTVLVSDPRTGRVFVSYLLTACSLLATTDNAGESWQQSEGCGPGALLDHQTVGVGPLHAPLAGVGTYNGAVYYCAQNSYNGACSVSLDGGKTFGPGVPVANTPANRPGDPFGGACSALHGHLRVGPDGTAYLPLKGCGGIPTVNNLTNSEYYGGRPSLSVSTNNGVSWQVRLGPGGSQDPEESDPSVAVGPKGTLYFGWEDGTQFSDYTGGSQTSARVATSPDGGRTWSRPIDLSTPLGVHNVQFPEMVVGDDNRAAFSFIGTPSVGNDQDNSFRGAWHLYIATTFDGGRHWSTVDATPQKPINRGCVHMLGLAPGSQRTDSCSYRNMLDFNDITVDHYGRVQVAYTDACIAACASGQTFHADGHMVALAYQVAGKTLLAKYDPMFAHTR